MVVYIAAYKEMAYREVNAFNSNDIVSCCQQKEWCDSKVTKSKNLINQMMSCEEEKFQIESLKPGALLMKISLLKYLKTAKLCEEPLQRLEELMEMEEILILIDYLVWNF